VSGIKVNGHPEYRLPNTLSVSFSHLEAPQLLAAMAEVAASSGAACHSDAVEVSAVLTAMHVPLDYALGTIRFSTGRMTTAEEIDRALDIITAAVHNLRSAVSAAHA
jgi:cysteine desulfurase